MSPKVDANALAASATLLTPPTTVGNVKLTALAAAEAPPPSSDQASMPVNLQPLASAALLHSTAHANYLASNQCFLGGNLTDAEADATDLNVLGLPGLVTTRPGAASRNFSSTRLVPQTDELGNLLGNASGLASLNTQNLAPVNIGIGVGGLSFTPAAISLNLGQWALEAAATGAPGGAFVTYGPTAGTTGDPVVATISLAGVTIVTITLSQIVGPTGFDTDSLGNGALNAVLRLQIGVPPTVTTSPDGTAATASADIVHLTVFNLPPAVTRMNLESTESTPSSTGFPGADVRIGHMEAAAQVPDGGIACTLHPTKTASPDPVTVGQNFVYDIGVPNPNACILKNVKVTDILTAAKGIKFTVSQTNPTASVSPLATDPANSVNNAVTVVFNNIGDIPPGGTGHARIVVNIDPSSGTGIFTDRLHVDSTCGVGTAGGSNKLINVAAPGDLILEAPTVGSGAVQDSRRRMPAVPPGPPGPGTLARTGGTRTIYVWLGGLGLLGFVAADRIRRRAAGSSTE